MKENALEGKVAIVTGGASGIGEATGKIFVENSCKVILVDINRDRLEKVAGEVGKGGTRSLTFLQSVAAELRPCPKLQGLRQQRLYPPSGACSAGVAEYKLPFFVTGKRVRIRHAAVL